jgi:hypothetical protein
MTLFPWGTKPGPWRTSPRDGVLLGWAGGTFDSYATARDAEAPEEDGGLKRRPGPKISRERAHAEDLCEGGARLQDSLHPVRTPRVKRAKTPG